LAIRGHLLPERVEEIWRRGSESNTPRFAKQTDNGFEDREGHQAPITLRREKEKTKLPKISNIAHDRVGVREFSGRDFRINLLSISDNFKHTAARRDQRERSDPLLQLQELVRQTDGLRLVVSSRAIFDGDFQGHVSIVEKTLEERLRSVKRSE
jgi:hypothetical protein